VCHSSPKYASPATAVAAWSETAVDGLIYYHVASWNNIYDQQACDAECGEYDYFIVGFEAWVVSQFN